LRATFVDHVFARHTHEGFCIGVVEAGGDRFDYRGADHVAPAGGIILINPGEPHNGRGATPEGWSYRTFYPPADLLRRVAADLTGRPRDVPFFAEPVAADATVARLLLAAHVASERGASRLERETRLLTALASLIARHADDPAPASPVRAAPPAVARVRDFLQSHLAEEITLDRLADLAGLIAVAEMVA
jgi:AraC-like protein